MTIKEAEAEAERVISRGDRLCENYEEYKRWLTQQIYLEKEKNGNFSAISKPLL